MDKENILQRVCISSRGRKWLFENIKERIPKLFLLMGLRVIGSFTGVAFALATKNVVNATISRDSEVLLSSMLILLGVITLQIIISSVSYHLQEKLLYLMDKDLKRTAFESILTSDYASLSGYHSGELLQRVNSDVSNITSCVITICTSAISLVTGLCAAVVTLLKLSPKFTLLIIPVCCLLAVATILSERDLKVVQKNMSRASGKLSGFYQEAMEKLLIVQSLDISDEIVKKSETLIDERIRHQKAHKDIQVRMNVTSSVFGYLSSFVALVWCAFQVLNGAFDYGTLTAITSLVSQLQGPLLSLPGMVPKFILLSACTERILEVIGAQKQEESAEFDLQNTYENIRYIRGENITFAYPDRGEQKIVLNNTDFVINPKTMTVLTGSSGGGKSTLLKLLLGIYRPNTGELYFEMKNGDKLPVNRSMRGLFSYAPQGNLILSGTIRENILIANPSATEEELENALYISAMDHYIHELPQGLDTVLGENGAGLSEGQVQRINIARAIVRKAPILLLDEVTSSLDMETEKTVLERIHRLTDITCIAVTHRPAALELADWQLHVLDRQFKEIKR